VNTSIASTSVNDIQFTATQSKTVQFGTNSQQEQSQTSRQCRARRIQVF